MQSLPLGMPLTVKPRYQRYAWGDAEFIPRLFGFEADGGPYAEAWLGAHERLPAQVLVGNQSVPLDQLLQWHGEAVLGQRAYERYRGLPFLLKVLAAAQPLSIQVHPSLEQARAGFAREDQAGIPVDAPHRNYRDRNHKPELIIALTPFFALCGFRPVSAIRADLAAAPELSALLPPLEARPDSLKTLLQSYLELDETSRSGALTAWLGRLEVRGAPPENSRFDWLGRAHRLTQREGRPDPGLFFFLLLELFELSPGQGLFLSAGIVHAYLKGAGVEVMANSDNVLRCGLTTKHTDPRELMRIVRFDAQPTHALDPEVESEPSTPATDGNTVELERYTTKAPEFRLHSLRLGHAGRARYRARGPELLLVVNPGARLCVTGSSAPSGLVLGTGEACLIPHDVSYELEAHEPSHLMRVSIPDV